MMQASLPRWCCPAGTGWPVPADVGLSFSRDTGPFWTGALRSRRPAVRQALRHRRTDPAGVYAARARIQQDFVIADEVRVLVGPLP